MKVYGSKAGILGAVFVASLLLGVFKAEAAAETKYLTIAAPPSSAAFYTYWVAVGKVLENAYPEYKVSVSESQGAIDIAKKIRSNMAPLGNGQSDADYANYLGTDFFQGKPFEDARVLWYYDKVSTQFIVAKDSGVKALKDLEGKKFNPGGTGMSLAIFTRGVFDELNIKPNYFEAGQASAADALVNRQIIGTAKNGIGIGADSYVVQILANIPVDLISLSEEETQKIIARFPYCSPAKIKAGTYKGIDYDVNTVGQMESAVSSTALSQEDGYRIIAAMNTEEGKKVWQAAYPSGKAVDMLELTLQSKVPLHAGTVQYLKEKGCDVPKQIIPPEYVEKK